MRICRVWWGESFESQLHVDWRALFCIDISIHLFDKFVCVYTLLGSAVATTQVGKGLENLRQKHQRFLWFCAAGRPKQTGSLQERRQQWITVAVA